MNKDELIVILDEISNIFNDINRVLNLGNVYAGMIKECNEKISCCNSYIKEYDNFKSKLTKQQQAILNDKTNKGMKMLYGVFTMIVIPILGVKLVMSRFGKSFDNFIYGFCLGFFVLNFVFIGLCYIVYRVFSPCLNKINENKHRKVNEAINMKVSEYQNSNKEKYAEAKEEIKKCLDIINNISQKVLDVEEHIKGQQEKLYEYEHIVPRKYLKDGAIGEFREYIYYGRATNIGECINIYEQIQMHNENIKFKQEEMYMKQMMYEEELYQQQVMHEKELKYQEQTKEIINDIAKSNETIIKQNKEKMKLDKRRYEDEQYERLKREKKELRRELGYKN